MPVSRDGKTGRIAVKAERFIRGTMGSIYSYRVFITENLPTVFRNIVNEISNDVNYRFCTFEM